MTCGVSEVFKIKSQGEIFMKNREEEIKAFFDDEEKIKAIANDKEFLDKVSGGEATPKTYKEEFKKLGLDLTDEESAQTAEMINEIRSTPDEKLPEKLNDLLLGDISGGEEGEFTPEDNDNYSNELKLARQKSDRLDSALLIAKCVTGVVGAVTSLAVLIIKICKLRAHRE